MHAHPRCHLRCLTLAPRCLSPPFLFFVSKNKNCLRYPSDAPSSAPIILPSPCMPIHAVIYDVSHLPLAVSPRRSCSLCLKIKTVFGIHQMPRHQRPSFFHHHACPSTLSSTMSHTCPSLSLPAVLVLCV